MNFLRFFAQTPIILFMMFIMWLMLKYSSVLAINLIKLMITLLMIGSFARYYKRIVWDTYWALCNLRFFSLFRIRSCTTEVYDNVAQYILVVMVGVLIYMLYESVRAFVPKKTK